MAMLQCKSPEASLSGAEIIESALLSVSEEYIDDQCIQAMAGAAAHKNLEQERRAAEQAHSRDATVVSVVRSGRKVSSFAECQQLAEGAPLMRMPFCGKNLRTEGRYHRLKLQADRKVSFPIGSTIELAQTRKDGSNGQKSVNGSDFANLARWVDARRCVCWDREIFCRLEGKFCATSQA